MLIEVIISALLVALIVVATLTGFDSVNRASADQRFHNQASLLAAQSQEALRSDPATALTTLVERPHTYTSTVNGETYTIEQVVEYVPNTTETTTCNTSSSKPTAGLFARITSTVTWPQLKTAKRNAVSESSIITPPDGSGLEVDATDESTPPVPVEGVNVTVEEEKGSTTTTSTSKEGCAIFAAIPATQVSLLAYKPGFVAPGGEYKVNRDEVLIAPNLTTHESVILGEGGAIEGEFVYKGSKEFNGVTVTGDTFVAYNHNMGISPEFEVGSTKVNTSESGTYEALPATSATGYAATATTPVNAVAYPTGNLFPFPAPWTVYAGDCQGNQPPASVLEEQTENEEGLVTGGATTKVKVPMSYVNLSVYSGTASGSTAGSLETGGEAKNKGEPYVVKITNLGNGECKETPNNSAKAQGTIHVQKVATTKESATLAGHLIAPFQPFGKFELCLWSKELKKTYKLSYENTTTEGSVSNIYLGASPGSKGVTILEGQNINTC